MSTMLAVNGGYTYLCLIKGVASVQLILQVLSCDWDEYFSGCLMFMNVINHHSCPTRVNRFTEIHGATLALT